MIRNLPNSAGYSDSKGIFAARKAVMHYTQQQGIKGVTLDDIYLGNGASELIVMATNALLNDGDELLVPAPDYPLWTAATSLSGGTPVHYMCDEANGWMPDLDDIRAKITPRTAGIVVINPNNPTGALYPTSCCWASCSWRASMAWSLADEVYDKVLYDGVKHTAMASLSTDVLTLTFNSLSKAYRSCGYRAGWMVVSGDKRRARLHRGPEHAGLMRCAPTCRASGPSRRRWAATRASTTWWRGRAPARQRDLAYELITQIPGVSCVKPRRRCTCSRAWTRRCTRSRTTSSSSWSCCAPRA
jgi:alanine-synthesizing transaminase